jgi:hypothetical protein
MMSGDATALQTMQLFFMIAVGLELCLVEWIGVGVAQYDTT